MKRLKRLFSSFHHIIAWTLEVIGLFFLGFAISTIFNIDYSTALLMIIIAMMVDVQMEVDRISRGRRYIESMIKCSKLDVEEEIKEQKRKESNE